jgi:hypothetical protein
MQLKCCYKWENSTFYPLPSTPSTKTEKINRNYKTHQNKNQAIKPYPDPILSS